ncbi:MAG: hypothetical protein DYG98_05950 [Haliscomenobacteraceae bacterium CHB4]|nr:hypothetical protein [Saprospiraceae bacterium]MCE7922577.1 hypothetical protein [Haliscomenobacteraceae bacterium CHB4]
MFFPILVITAMAAFAAGIFWFKQQRKAQRRNELQQLAETMGLPFYEKDLFGLSNQLKAFDLFKRERGFRWGRGGHVTNVMRSQVDGTDVWLFDYSYVVHAGNTHREVRQTVFFANDKNFQLPDFRLRPENWWQKLLGVMGAKKDINFPEHPDFSNRFWLTGEIEALIREKFSPELQRFLTERPPVHLEGSNYYLIAYKPGKALNADETQVFFEHCCQLVQLMKAEGKSGLLDLAEMKKVDAERLSS